MLEYSLLGIMITILGIWFGSIEMRIRKMDDKLRDVPSKLEVSKEIEVRQEALKVMQQEIKEDIRYMRNQLDKLIETK